MGTAISYWFDTWRYPTVEKVTEERIRNRPMSLRDAVTSSASYTQEILITGQLDEIYWLWTTNGFYSAKSLYGIMSTGGRETWQYVYIWRLKIPPTVRIFAYLWLKGKVLTHDRMQERGITCELSCATCAECTVETAMHLFFRCPYAAAFWARINLIIGHRIMIAANTVQTTFDSSWRRCKRRFRKQTWSTIFIAACWFLWKERNNSIFQRKLRDPRWVADRAIEEARLWMAKC